MKKKKIYWTYALKALPFLLCVLLLGACKKDFQPEDNFVKVYDDQDGNRNYFPLSIKQTSDQGYVILSAYNGWNILVMKISKTGEFEWKYELPSNYVNAVPNIIAQAGNNYFICMDEIGLFTYVMKIDEDLKSAVQVQDFPYILYPTAAYSNGTSIYVQNYSRFSNQTGIYSLNADLTDTLASGKVNVIDNVEDKIVEHITYSGKRMPFFITSTPENDYVVMGGFNNYSFSMICLDQNLKFKGVYNGSNYNGGPTALLPLGGSTYSMARFSYSNLYYNPNVTIDPEKIDIAENLPATGMAELDAKKPVLIRRINIDGKSYVAFVATTHMNQLLISFYDPASGLVKGKKYIGQNVPYVVCDWASSAENDLILLVQAKIMGSYNRIATIKFSEAQLKESLE